MMQKLARTLGLHASTSPPPLSFEEVATPAAEVASLFLRCFNAQPPDTPRHFVALLGSSVCGYVHLTPIEPDVFLVGGLCIDRKLYRRLTREARREIAKHGSLSRWLLERAIEIAGPKRAVFAYTGNTMSRRDCAALGFVAAAGPYLIVQWHGEPTSTRDELVRRIERLGPF